MNGTNFYHITFILVFEEILQTTCWFLFNRSNAMFCNSVRMILFVFVFPSFQNIISPWVVRNRRCAKRKWRFRLPLSIAIFKNLYFYFWIPPDILWIRLIFVHPYEQSLKRSKKFCEMLINKWLSTNCIYNLSFNFEI